MPALLRSSSTVWAWPMCFCGAREKTLTLSTFTSAYYHLTVKKMKSIVR